ncbi:hypothetical protein BCR33DRAFT_768674 [Rhizoclosmatium globosum]|uniref:C2HC/C3H-type domain-containing protein n=1 Tax=Rhizoclosmatium globosum TaxID=329046 RepID=A0A1Y2BZ11_9FUNG|nr:hypothetical protein BCR33DRAFT_768674 [Rhizoclosmatium globosum]|eukprot:ORY39315.1 hypothetical protein BCR33DRAFT_768674 [Rhizoclosmatium globosum]
MNSLVVDSKPGAKCPSVTCYLCGREFGTASIAIHEPKCIEKWERSQAALPKDQRRPRPTKPVPIQPSSAASAAQNAKDLEAYNAAARDAYLETARVECQNCGRKFEQGRLEIHLRSCKPGGFFAKKMEQRKEAAERAQTSAVEPRVEPNMGGSGGGGGGDRGSGNNISAASGIKKLSIKPGGGSSSSPNSSINNLASNSTPSPKSTGRPITGRTPSVRKPSATTEQSTSPISVTGTVAKQSSRASTATPRKSNPNTATMESPGGVPKFCAECGMKQIVENWKFCAECGAKRPA